MPEEKHIEELFGLYGDLKSPSRLAADRESLTAHYGRFSAQPFELGFGATIGKSLRRALLDSLEGAAITAVKFEGVEYAFASLPGVVEEATDIILNVQKLSFKLDSSEPKTLRINKSGAGEVTAADIEADGDVEILDPAAHIATVTDGGSLRMEMRLKRGRGYVTADKNFEDDLEPGYIVIDSAHTPVKKCNYLVDTIRVGHDNFDRLSIEIWTDGSVRPEDALGLAANLIKHHMSIFINFKEITNQALLVKLNDYGQITPLREVQQDVAKILGQLEPKSDVDLVSTVREVVQEESTARNYVTKRYRALIDRKYISGLSASEHEELDALRLTLEEMDKPYYEAIIERLRNLIEQSGT